MQHNPDNEYNVTMEEEYMSSDEENNDKFKTPRQKKSETKLAVPSSSNQPS